MRHLDLARLPVLAAALVLVASSAHAFTFGSAGASDGVAIVDPDDQTKSFGAGSSNPDEGGRSVQFGVRPSFGSGPTSSLVPSPSPSKSPSWPAPGAFPYHQ